MPTEPEQKVDLATGFGQLLVRSPNINVALTEDGRVILYKGREQTGVSAKADFKTALNTGDVIPDGPNKDWIYCAGDNVAPFLIAPKDSGVVTYREAVKIALAENADIPNKRLLQQLFLNRNIPALKTTFKTCDRGEASWYWSSTPSWWSPAVRNMWVKRFQDGKQPDYYQPKRASLRLIRPYTPA